MKSELFPEQLKPCAHGVVDNFQERVSPQKRARHVSFELVPNHRPASHTVSADHQDDLPRDLQVREEVIAY